MVCPRCKTEMALIQDEAMGRSWGCPECLDEVSEDFTHMDVRMDGLHKTEGEKHAA